MNTKSDSELSKYDDIIHLPRHVSKTRPPMPMKNRAAQFAPFAAVVGHQSAVDEAARRTDQKLDLDEYEKGVIDDALGEIESNIQDRAAGPEGPDGGRDVEIVYFVPDTKKAGGKYLKKSGTVCKIETYHRQVHMDDGTIIPIEEIYSIELAPS